MRAVEAPALGFLRCRTPAAWLDRAVGAVDLLLQDHATLELKAAEQAQKLIRRYGADTSRRERMAGRARTGSGHGAASRAFRLAVVNKMSRLAREELRHFEQVVEILTVRGLDYQPVSASRYAAGLHSLVRTDEPGTLIDTLLVGAIIEARSCERFASLAPVLEPAEPELAKFYVSLLRSEGRHFQDYLRLAREAASMCDDETAALGDVDARLDSLLDRDAELVTAPDGELRFHSGPPQRVTPC